MIVPSRFIRSSFNTGMRGLGYDEMRLTHPENACAPGLKLVGGNCFREIGPTGNPVAGPDSNNDIAEQVLGAGVSCDREMVDVGPYVYAQNVCRDRTGNVVSGADEVAEHNFVQQSLYAKPGQPFVYNAGAAANTASGVRQNVTPPAAPAVATPPVTHGGSQVQSPTQAPTTQQGKNETPAGGGAKQTVAVEDNSNSLLIVGAIAAAAFFFVRGGK